MGPGEKYCDIKTLLTEDSAVRIVVIVVFSSRPSISTQLRIIITNTDTKPTPAPFTPPPPQNKQNKQNNDHPRPLHHRPSWLDRRPRRRRRRPPRKTIPQPPYPPPRQRHPLPFLRPPRLSGSKIRQRTTPPSNLQPLHARLLLGYIPPPYVPPSKLIPPATTILTQQFPSPPHSLLSPSTLALVSLLHDIGTAPSFLSTTQLSFEFAGALVARDLLLHASPPSPLQNTPSSPPSPPPTHSIPLSTQSQTEAIIETIIRHQDIGTTGTITFLGQLIQLATLYDNIGGNPGLVHADTKVDVNRAFPRAGWSGCFAATVREEMRLKPWAHSTHLGEEEFPAGVEGNALMREFDAWE